jgi:hypothetical protein
LNSQSARYDYKFNQPTFVTYLPGSLTSVAGASKAQTRKSGTMYVSPKKT